MNHNKLQQQLQVTTTTTTTTTTQNPSSALNPYSGQKAMIDPEDATTVVLLNKLSSKPENQKRPVPKIHPIEESGMHLISSVALQAQPVQTRI
eukprot:m.51644 g.51644  ORF g.51644 m.51644 type:complete len:93 (-) comp10745_c0_seq2:257-535(-)